jgi:hypothetical protein
MRYLRGLLLRRGAIFFTGVGGGSGGANPGILSNVAGAFGATIAGNRSVSAGSCTQFHIIVPPIQSDIPSRNQFKPDTT